MGHIKLTNVAKSFGAIDVLHDINLEIADGEFVVLVGPSGCGKSTLLRMVAGLEEVSGGRIMVDGRTINDLPAKDRNIAMVFQTYALFPHMSVEKNLSFGLKLRGTPRAEADRRVREAAALLRLEPLMHRKPGQLSGGQRQRVAIGRALVREPAAFLMDEPLSNLDAKLRVHMRTEFARLRERLRTTTIYVTHDQIEAMTLGDRVCVMRDGVIQQVDTPDRLFRRPSNIFVAGFIGSPHMNFLEGSVAPSSSGKAVATFAGGNRLELPVAASSLANGSPITLGVRPQHVLIGNGTEGISAKVKLVEALGSETILHTDVAGQKILVVAPGQHNLTPGADIRLSLSSAPLHLFDEKGLRLDHAV
jgi:ABC-type sugar transport system ATPase subunit